jgi:NADPH-dependent ferric siderophore reductase
VPNVNDPIEGPRVTRVRHELKRRLPTVARVERLPPNMVRVVLSGEELRGFTSLGFDDHVKVFFPNGGGTTLAGGSDSRSAVAVDGAGAPAMRDFTPRRFDIETGELWIDCFLHEGGPAAAWAAQASVGQTLEIGGPKGSAIIALDGIEAHVLIGDETALPAISRRLEELPVSTRTLIVIELDADSERPVLASSAAMDVVWVARERRGGAPAQEIIGTLRGLEFPPGRCFVWVAGESQAARAIRSYLRDERGFDKKWIKAAGYWQRGAAGTHDSIQDEV